MNSGGETMKQIIHEMQDMTYLSWAKTRNSSGIAGSFLKAYEEGTEGKTYYKLSNYDAWKGITGHECVNEIIVDRLLTVLGIEHLSYQLIHALVQIDQKRCETWLCASRDFKRRGESKIALDAYYQAERLPDESPMDFCIRSGWEETVYEMLVVDFLILNRDRHGANIEVLRNPRQKTIRLAPLFDHGLSLLSRCESIEDMLHEDVMADKPVQCFVGSRSSLENVKRIPADRRPHLNRLSLSDRPILLEGLSDALDQRWLDRIWEMIWGRWQVYENLCNKG